MAEVIGIVASVVSIVQAAKTCIEIYTLIDDGKHASKDQRRLVSQLKEQRLRFFLWCDNVGITETLHQNFAVSSGSGLEVGDVSRLSPQLQRYYVCTEILSILNRIKDLFQDSDELLKKYTTQRSEPAVRSLMRLTSHDYSWFGLGESISASEATIRDTSKAPKCGMSVWKSGLWSTIDKKKLTDLVDQLRLTNDGLQSILGMVERKHLRRINQLLATTTPFAGVVATAHSLEDVRLIEPPNQATIQPSSENYYQLDYDDRDTRLLVELYRHGHAIDRDINSDLVESSIVPESVTFAPSLFADDFHLLSSDLDLPDLTRPSTERVFTYYKSKPVVVEWKYYSSDINQELLMLLKKRVSMLASQLQRSSETSGFHTLSCAGYFDNAELHRIGIMFQLPDSGASSPPLSLRDRMIQDRSTKNVRDLTSRFSIAKDLVMAMYRLHLVGWLHKSVRSDNILFFENPRMDQHSLAAPFICGFDFSRQDSPTEMTEDVPTVLLSGLLDRERSLYRHPDLDIRISTLQSIGEDLETSEALNTQAEEAAAQSRYCKAYDVYSLGIVLLEIGLWCPVKDLCGRKESLQSFRERLNNQLLPELRYRAGKIYFEVVRRCLEGDLGQEQMPTPAEEKAGNSEVEELRESRMWLAGFDKHVVSEIERCNV